MKEKDYLDPTNDYVFKRMVCDSESEPALISMINAIIEPEVPITSVEVQNSEILATELEGHNIRLDIRARLENGTRINIEMQSWPRDAFNNRLLYQRTSHNPPVAKLVICNHNHKMLLAVPQHSFVAVLRLWSQIPAFGSVRVMRCPLSPISTAENSYGERTTTQASSQST